MNLTDAKLIELHRAVAELRASDPIGATPPQPPRPTELAAWQKRNVPDLQKHLTSDDGSPTAVDVAVATTMIVYGPATAGPPPAAVVVAAAKAARVSKVGDQAEIERLLVYGLTPVCSNQKSGWEETWSGARAAFENLVADQIRAAVGWLAWRVDGLDPWHAPWNRFVKCEVDACASLLAAALIHDGCGCSSRWDNFKIASQALARKHCKDEHRLGAWDGAEPLTHFLFRACCKGRLQLPNLKLQRPEVAQVNDFRRAMLIWAYQFETLEAGPVLRCDNCDGEINVDDRCNTCGTIGKVDEPAFWLWRYGNRKMCFTHRCESVDVESVQREIAKWNDERDLQKQVARHRFVEKLSIRETADKVLLGAPEDEKQLAAVLREVEKRLANCRCGHLYFNHSGTCPNCGNKCWSTRPTMVWVRIRAAAGMPAEELPVTREQDGDVEAVRQQFIFQIEDWPDGIKKEIALGLFRDQHNVEEIAQRLKLSVDEVEGNLEGIEDELR